MHFTKYLKAILKFSLPIGFALIIIMMTSTSFFTMTAMGKTSKEIIDSNDAQNYYEGLLKTMYSVVYERTLILGEMLNTDDPFRNDELFLKLNELSTEFVIARSRFVSQDLNPRMRKLLDTQGHLITINKAQVLDVYESILNNDIERAKKLFINVTLPRQRINLEMIDQMIDLQFWLEQDKVDIAEESLIESRSILLFVNGAILFMSIFISFFLLLKQRKENSKLHIEATTDNLTGLPNRSRLIANMDEFIKQKPTHTFAVLFFDIDFFKSINDNYGHSVGDLVIQNFAHRIKTQIQKNDILSRFGGDEFVLLLRSIKSEKQAREFVAKLSSSLNTSFSVKNNEIFITASIGVSLYDKSCEDFDGCITSKSLLKQSDIAMYSAKKSGRNCFRFFSKEDSAKLASDYAISHSLHTLLKNDNAAIEELSLVYQPLVRVNDQCITECEALIRWKTHEGKEIPPNIFIPLAEKSYLIEKINHFVIDAACKQQSKWRHEGVTGVRININLSGNGLIFRSTLQRFEERMNIYSLCPSHFGIELTERTLFEISEETIRKLDILRRQGMKISIDDFGTEYSSLSYLKKLPITTLKIDKSFIAGIPADKDDQALVKSIIGIGHSLQLDVVAEGVETIEQLSFLKNNACNTVQGYFFHRPLNSKLIPKLKLVA